MNIPKKSILIAIIVMAAGTCQASGMESREEQRKSIEVQLISTTKNLQNTLYDTFNNPWAETEAKRLATQLSRATNRSNKEIKNLLAEADYFISSNEQVVFTNIYGYSEAGIHLLIKAIQILINAPLLIP